MGINFLYRMDHIFGCVEVDGYDVVIPNAQDYVYPDDSIPLHMALIMAHHLSQEPPC
ncbi:MAG: hypothetical protein AOA65_1322 [Candidatus Bathyarchaeota archaeon BA1]|nr:MAG: hypothetical protein AOA65_1322 [Candidatus Bathyarchaeota archaeon BA1]